MSQNQNSNDKIIKRDSNYIHNFDTKNERVKLMRKVFQTFDLVYYLFQPHEAFMRKYKVSDERPYEKYPELMTSDTLCEINHIEYRFSNKTNYSCNSPSIDLDHVHMIIQLKINNNNDKIFSLVYH